MSHIIKVRSQGIGRLRTKYVCTNIWKISGSGKSIHRPLDRFVISRARKFHVMAFVLQADQMMIATAYDECAAGITQIESLGAFTYTYIHTYI